MIDESKGFFVRKEAWFHLIHHVREADSILRVTETQAATGPGLTKSIQLRPKYFPRLLIAFQGVFHESDAERGLNAKNLIFARALSCGNSAEGLRGKYLLRTKGFIESR
jgi:hypothetical protein